MTTFLRSGLELVFLVILTFFWLLVFFAWFAIADIASAADRMACSTEPVGKDWHYRTKIPGFSGDVKDDRCWYDGPRMKPRNELYWDDKPAPMVARDPPWNLDHRFRGAKEGWDTKE